MMRFVKLSGIALIVFLVVATVSCRKSDETAGEPTAEVEIPAALFVASPPAEAVPLIEAKSAAKQGDRVTFEARIGGRVDPFVANRAIFTVADPSLLSCDDLPGDVCKTPWDYCCEPAEVLLKHVATVQVVDEDGGPLKISLKDVEGLSPLKRVIISGTVDQVDPSGNFVVNADRIYVKET